MRTLALRSASSGPAFLGENAGDTLSYDPLKRGFAVAPAVLSIAAFGVSSANSPDENTDLINEALATALERSGQLYWPDVYEVSGNLVGMHEVQHWGPGGVLRGSDTFHVRPADAQTNRLYIAATGDAEQDGLTAALPMATPQDAFDALKNYGPVLGGTWRVQVAAGTWAGTAHRQTLDTPSVRPVIIEGPNVGGHPNVPTAIFDGTVGAVADDWCMRATGQGVQVDWRNLKAQNYVGAAATGFLADYGAVVYWSNIHGSGNTYSDTYFQGCAVVRGGGGIWASPRGALVNGCVDTTIGYGAVPVRLSGNTNAGIEWSRGTEGHIDYCEFTGCKVGVDVMHNARVHLMGNNFKTSTTAAVRARTSGIYYDDLATPNNFNNGTADKNAVNFLNYVGSGESDEDLFLSQGMRRRAYDKNSHNLTGTTSLTVLSTLLTGAVNSRIPAYWFEDNTKKILVRVTGVFATASALSSIGVSLGGIEIDRLTLASPGPAANSIFFYECEIEATGPNAQFKKSRLWVDGMVSRLQQNSPTVTTSANLALTVNGKLANSGDSMSVYWCEAWLVG